MADPAGATNAGLSYYFIFISTLFINTMWQNGLVTFILLYALFSQQHLSHIQFRIPLTPYPGSVTDIIISIYLRCMCHHFGMDCHHTHQYFSHSSSHRIHVHRDNGSHQLGPILVTKQDWLEEERMINVSKRREMEIKEG